MDKQAFDAMVRQYAADLMGMAARSTLPPEPASPPTEETSPQPEAPAPIEPDEGVEINPPESGPGVDPLQPAVPEPESYESFLADNPQMGELRIQASAGGRLCRFPGGSHRFPGFCRRQQGVATGITDGSGILDGIRLPAPDKGRSQSPEPGKPSYAAYTVTVSHPQFQTQVFTQVPVSKGSSLSSPSGSCRRGRTFNREAST